MMSPLLDHLVRRVVRNRGAVVADATAAVRRQVTGRVLRKRVERQARGAVGLGPAGVPGIGIAVAGRCRPRRRDRAGMHPRVQHTVAVAVVVGHVAVELHGAVVDAPAPPSPYPSPRRAAPGRVNVSCSSVARLVAPRRRSVVWLPVVVSVTSEPLANQRASAIWRAQRARPGQAVLVVEVAGAEQDVLAVLRTRGSAAGCRRSP